VVDEVGGSPPLVATSWIGADSTDQTDFNPVRLPLSSIALHLPE
jgi:hypothetical protein